jgi:3-deoxy-D-manno-octulosonate 8-phosphate phosphatase (KDO 8-P phosphatase)
MPKPSAKARARKIKLILFDVDGVLTDGKIWIFPAPLDGKQSVLEKSASASSVQMTGASQSDTPRATHGEASHGPYTLVEAKGFNAHDGAGISLARLGGIKTGLITKRTSETVALRARDLKMEHVHQGIHDKAGALRQIIEKEGITAAEAAFVGDDVIDLPVMRKCGLAIAVKNARPEVKAEAHYVTPHAGGDGAARDAIEFILKAQGKWKQVVAHYTKER